MLRRTFFRDTRGTIAMIFALSIMAIIGTVGLAIDGARVYGVGAKLTAALDAAALVAAKRLNEEGISDAEVQRVALNFFNANMAAMGAAPLDITSFHAVPDRANSSVTINVSTSIPTTFGQVLKIPTFDFGKSATVVYKMKKIELALVLDITGSMSGSKLAEMKTAARNVIDTIFATNPLIGQVRVSIVPYSASVNVGPYAALVSNGQSADGCVVERTGAEAATDSPPANGAYFNVINAPQPGFFQTCPSDAIQPLSYNASALRSAIDSLGTSGGTAGHIGTAWGWYTLSPNWNGVWPAASLPNPHTDANTVKSILIMTDGLFNTSFTSLGTAHPSDPATQIEESYTQFQNLCSAMKTKGISIYTVGFDLTDVRASNELQACANAPSQFFLASNGDQLRQAFAAVTAHLLSLRVTQ